MKKIIIVGAGGFGRDVVDIIDAINKVSPEWEVLGFIDDNLHALDGVRCKYPIIGTIRDCCPSNDQYFVIGVASPMAKEKIVNYLKVRGAVFTTLIHPAALISDEALIGEGCIIGGRSSIGACAEIGNFVNIAGSMIGQDSVIGDYSTTTAFTNVVSAYIGKRVMIGSHAVVLNHLKIGDDVLIGTGSIVVKNVKAGTTVMGYPAKKVDL